MAEERVILTIDIGNTATKVCVFRGERLMQSVVGTDEGMTAIDAMLGFNSVDGIACCCVGADRHGVVEALERGNIPFVALRADTPLPIDVRYGSRDTLGADRVAAAVGAYDGSHAVLVVDAGTAVTADIVADGAFLGGNISPGLKLRFRSLNRFTSSLPLVSPDGRLPVFGDDTESAIRAGVVNGLVAELHAAFCAAKELYNDISMILTGGDSAFLAPLLSNDGISLRTDTEVVGRGLVRIFNYNNSNLTATYE